MLDSDTLFALLCLLTGAAIPVVLVALVLSRARRQLRTSGAYREVARNMGLDVDTRGLSLQGVREDRPLWVGEVLVGQLGRALQRPGALSACRSPCGSPR